MQLFTDKYQTMELIWFSETVWMSLLEVYSYSLFCFVPHPSSSHFQRRRLWFIPSSAPRFLPENLVWWAGIGWLVRWALPKNIWWLCWHVFTSPQPIWNWLSSCFQFSAHFNDFPFEFVSANHHLSDCCWYTIKSSVCLLLWIGFKGYSIIFPPYSLSLSLSITYVMERERDIHAHTNVYVWIYV